MNAFITGSHAYGKPNKESDVDLVIRVNRSTATILRKLAGTKNNNLRFGKLNLILCENDLEAAMWRFGTAKLRRKKRPIDKEEAKEILDELRDAVGLIDLYQSELR